MIKKGKKKQKLVFAKDPKQAALAILVILLFLANSLYMIVKHCIDVSREHTAVTAPANPAEQNPNGQPNGGPNAQPDAQGNKPGAMPPGATPPGAPTPGAAPSPAGQNGIYNQTLNQNNSPLPPPPGVTGMPQGADDSVDIISKTPLNKQKGKQVLISVGNSGRSNPFLPAGENYYASSTSSKAPKTSLPAPPTYLQTNSDASKVMTTTISGILYDKYSPSAIINIEGADYLVKRGDVINHYKVLSISPNRVIVQLGKNIYQAGVGQLLSLTSLNQNTIANLNKKFAGNTHRVSKVSKGGRKRG